LLYTKPDALSLLLKRNLRSIARQCGGAIGRDVAYGNGLTFVHRKLTSRAAFAGGVELQAQAVKQTNNTEEIGLMKGFLCAMPLDQVMSQVVV